MVDMLLRVSVILRGVSGAVIVAASASADELFSRKSTVGTGTSGRERRFREFPIGVVAKVVVVVWEGDRVKARLMFLINHCGNPEILVKILS